MRMEEVPGNGLPTVPLSQTLPTPAALVTATKVWNVRASRFPLGIGDVVGQVGGVDRHDAQRKAEDLYGRHVVVDPATGGLNPPEQNGVRVDRDNGTPARGRSEPFDRPETRRPMTQDEARMAQALSCQLTGRQVGKSLARTLHARSLGADRSISVMEAKLLRGIVLEHRAALPPHIVELAGGAS